MGATFVGMPVFPEAAHAALADTQLRHNLAHATGTIRDKRARVVAEVDNWEELRTAGRGDQGRHPRRPRAAPRAARGGPHRAGRHRALGPRRRGGQPRSSPRWRRSHGVDEVVKVKSMATQEIGLNEALAAEGIAAWETDLAELIVQLGEDLPSHILVPAIHRNRAEIRQIFLDHMAAAGRPAPET